MKISIITTSYNSGSTLRDAMESVLRQTHQDIEYLIIDGGSRDNTLELVRSYVPRFGAKLHYLSEPDKGIYDAMNKGIRMATGDVIGFLNSDDFYTHNTVLEQVAQAFTDTRLDAVYGDVHYVEPENLYRCVRYYSSRPFRRCWMRFGLMPAHPSFYCRREVYTRCGAFDITYKVAADFENLLRLIYVNRIRTRYIPLDFVTMRTGGASTSGLHSHRLIMADHLRALRTNGVYSNIFLLGLRYLYKIGELVRSRFVRVGMAICGLLAGMTATAQPAISEGTADFFVGVDLNYRDIFTEKPYEFLVNLTPGVKWNFGKQWQFAAQAIIPVYNDYGDYYKRVRLNMAVLSKEFSFQKRTFLKISGGWFANERYGLDVKGMYLMNDWLAWELQAGWTGFVSMAAGWQASTPERWTALAGANVYLNRWNTQFRVRGGRYIYEDYGASFDVMRHFRHCTVGLYAEYSDQWGENGGFKVIMMIPPYKRKQRKVNIRPASNFRLTYNVEANPYANKMYTTDPEENEREGWFNRDSLQWGSNRMEPDFVWKEVKP